MKHIYKIVIVFFIMHTFSGENIYAQNDTIRTFIKSNIKFFAGIGGGAGLFNGKDMVGSGISDRTAFDIEAYIGVWISSEIGFRIQRSGVIQKIKDGSSLYVNTHGDLLWNASNSIAGYNPDRIWDAIPYVGCGWIMLEGQSDKCLPIVGLVNNFHIAKNVDAVFELKHTFNLIGSNKESVTTVSLGITYTMGEDKYKNDYPQKERRTEIKEVIEKIDTVFIVREIEVPVVKNVTETNYENIDKEKLIQQFHRLDSLLQENVRKINDLKTELVILRLDADLKEDSMDYGNMIGAVGKIYDENNNLAKELRKELENIKKQDLTKNWMYYVLAIKYLDSMIVENHKSIVAIKNTIRQIRHMGSLKNKEEQAAMFFTINSAELSKDAIAIIDQYVKSVILKKPGNVYTIYGYADVETGTSSINLKISKERVDVVYDLLVNKYKINPNRLVKKPLGDTKARFTSPELNRCVIIE